MGSRGEGEYPGQVSDVGRGLLHPSQGGVPSHQDWMGVPPSGLDEGTPHQNWIGGTPSELGGGSPSQDWMGYPPARTGWE